MADLTGPVADARRAESFGARLPPLLIAAERVASTVAQGVHGRRRVGQGDSFWQFRRFVSGDLFDVFPLQDGRLGVFLGDVAGKGAGAAVLMAAAQSHLHAVLQRTGDPKQAVELLNSYLDGRCPSGSFITLFAAVIDPHDAGGMVKFCDAGHGYWLVRSPGEAPVRHECGGGPPLGVMAGFEYSCDAVPFAKLSRLVLYSDGVHEQRLPGGEEFGLARTVEALSQAVDPHGDVDALLGALTRAAGPDHARPNTAGDIAFADDVTIASIEML